MDPSPPREAAQASGNANQPGQTESITFMDLKYHNAAVKGIFEEFLEVQPSLNRLLTPNKNTILHVHITAINNRQPGAKAEFVAEVLNKCPELLHLPNAKLETPLHIAARYGHVAIVELLIERAKGPCSDLERQVEPVKEMLRMTTLEEDTALHEAVRYNHIEVVRLLVKNDPDFLYSANKASETLLYMSVERQFRMMASQILNGRNSEAYTGPLGRTALHAAVVWGDIEVIKELLAKINCLAEQDDDKRWTPLHLAVHFNKFMVVKLLLRHDRAVAYIRDAEGRTALHIAAHRGLYKIVKEIISSCPDCCEMVDKKGWNILHASMEGRWSPVTVRIILNRLFLSNLLNEKDNDGNTPLLRHSYSIHPALRSFVAHPRIDTKAFNKQNLNFVDIAFRHRERSIEKWVYFRRLLRRNRARGPVTRTVIEPDYTVKLMDEKEKEEGGSSTSSRLEKATETHLVVAALITTVTFAAGITMPGGFMGEDDSHPGSAILGKSTAFRAFIVTDTVSMGLSSLAVLAHMLLPLPWLNKPAQHIHYRNLHSLAFYSNLLALGAMVLAFVTGTYAVLAKHSSDIAIAVCIIGICFIPLFCLTCPRVVKRTGACLFGM